MGGRESIFLVLLNTKLKILKLIKKRINQFFKIIFLAFLIKMTSIPIRKMHLRV